MRDSRCAAERHGLLETSGGKDAVRFEGAEAIYRTLFDSMSEGAVAVSPEGTVLFCNRQFAKLVRRPPDRVIGAPFDSFVAPADGADLYGMPPLGRGTCRHASMRWRRSRTASRSP